ncbi:MAG: GDYXXLXY domain-containing protein [Magnetococcales bacterium]|nr:GDYXXLXY domain-containing protein [Magnetococcales bacterium]MBF0156243.1 GDYXXLXY domain-containing protein [Magnetococcales bacterium]
MIAWFGRYRLILSLLLPILALLGMVVGKESVRSLGAEVRLAIEGFDPRDLLSGHFLLYRVDYGPPVCHSAPENPGGPVSPVEIPAFVCLDEPRRFGYDEPEGCRLAIRGSCQGGRFIAGIERFYIPEEYARSLDRVVRDKQGEILVRIGGRGGAQVVALLIDGKPWDQAARSEFSSPEPFGR